MKRRVYTSDNWQRLHPPVQLLDRGWESMPDSRADLLRETLAHRYNRTRWYYTDMEVEDDA